MSIQLKAEIVLPVIFSLGLCILLSPIILPILRKLKFGQTEREDGPKSHLSKTGTPTMGGVIFLIAILVPAFIFAKSHPSTMPVLILTVGMGIIGFLDDYIKVVLKRSMGLRAWQKMLLQLILTAIFAYYVTKILHIDLAMKVPFMKDTYLDLGYFNIPLMFLVIVGTDNATNLTDGVDGLLSSITAVVASFFGICALMKGSDVGPICFLLLGGLLGFLIINCHPAKVFMGDTGSLAIGGFLAGVAYVLHMPLFLVIVGLVYVIEALSVMLQVGYFKLTHGKRIFRMAPIHHHFELGGWSEEKVVTVFTIVTILCCLIGFLGAW
ncbi:MAG TPA: phospho-N-acetylmuramoyl-pentapeptide-transferase [Lachnospiraceae bacterium]|nr:phospho-N-acetylmuramoyl-pentapeptide-transferase [Lachnospiraceae bacterium]